MHMIDFELSHIEPVRWFSPSLVGLFEHEIFLMKNSNLFLTLFGTTFSNDSLRIFLDCSLVFLLADAVILTLIYLTWPSLNAILTDGIDSGCFSFDKDSRALFVLLDFHIRTLKHPLVIIFLILTLFKTCTYFIYDFFKLSYLIVKMNN